MEYWSGGLWSPFRQTRRPEAAATGEELAEKYFPLTLLRAGPFFCPFMKVVSSIKSAKLRHPACQVVRRKGKIYVINKVEPRYKARQG